MTEHSTSPGTPPALRHTTAAPGRPVAGHAPGRLAGGPRASRVVAALAAVAALAVAGCSQAPANPVGAGATAPPASPSVSSPASAVSSSRPLFPLTGLPAGTAAEAAAPAVALTVSGTAPQGLADADVVFEEISNPVRYIAVYQSRTATTVGPITSTQPTDRGAVAVLHPLIGYDGAAAAYYIPLLDNTKIIDAGEGRYPSLYTSGASGITTTPQTLLRSVHGATTPPPLFTYRDPGPGTTLAAAGVSRPTGVSVTIPGLGTQTWTFDSHTDRWTATAGGPSFAAANLIIQDVPYATATINRHRGVFVTSATITGTGHAEVLSGSTGTGTGGTAAAGTWSKPHPTQVTNYLDTGGTPMTLQPGPTWIILAPTGTQVTTTGA